MMILLNGIFKFGMPLSIQRMHTSRQSGQGVSKVVNKEKIIICTAQGLNFYFSPDILSIIHEK